MEFATDWQFYHNITSPRNCRSYGQVEAAVKTITGLLTHGKCSSQDPYIAPLAYHSTPIDAHLHSPTEMLYQQVLCTTVPNGSDALTHMPMLNLTTSTRMPSKLQSATTSEAAARNLHSSLAK